MQVAIYELTEWEGLTARLEADVIQTAEPQEMSPAGSGLRMWLEELESTGSVTLRIDLSKLGPRECRMSLDLRMRVETESGGEALPMSMRMRTDMEIESP